MKRRKISTAVVTKAMTGVFTILMAISVTACGSTKEQTNQSNTEVTEAVVTTETESETATEAKVENEIASETEAVTETETEEPVLFRIRLKKMGDTEGAWVTNRPGEEFEDMFIVKAGTCFDVYEEAEETNGLFYKIELEDGSIGWVYSNDVEIID